MLSIINRKNLSVINLEPPLEWSLLLLKVGVARLQPHNYLHDYIKIKKIFLFCNR